MVNIVMKVAAILFAVLGCLIWSLDGQSAFESDRADHERIVQLEKQVEQLKTQLKTEVQHLPTAEALRSAYLFIYLIIYWYVAILANVLIILLPLSLSVTFAGLACQLKNISNILLSIRYVTRSGLKNNILGSDVGGFFVTVVGEWYGRTRTEGPEPRCETRRIEAWGRTLGR
jgi:hypothetical protein